MEANIARDCKHGRSGPTPHLPYEKIALSPTPSPHHLWQVRELVGIGHTHFQLQPSGEQPLKPSRTGPGGVGAGELTLRALKAGELPPPLPACCSGLGSAGELTLVVRTGSEDRAGELPEPGL